MGNYSFSGAPVFVRVLATGVYDINAFGAQGGGAYSYSGGKGAEEGGYVTLTAGEKLEIVVGQAGGVGAGGTSAGGGGGGGTFVLANTGPGGAYVALLVAGGGGGAYGGNGGAGSVGAPGNGSGGASNGFTGGGSGVKSDGAPSGVGGKNQSGAYAGGAAGRGSGQGGFGGGGGGGAGGGGGGGGYSGGAGYQSAASGAGATSFDSGTAIAAQTMAGVQSGNGSLNITPTPCFCPGTLILTERGEVPVELLAVGDRVVSLFGGDAPIRWIGHRTVDVARHPNPTHARPIRIQAGAFADGLPRRDLRLSPEHAVFVDGVLIPIRCLANGATIAQEHVERVTYYHVELDSHDVILAEGLPAESYLDCGNRAGFANGDGFTELHPDFAPRNWNDDACATLHLAGPVVEAARARLLERARMFGNRASAWPNLRLMVDGRVLSPVTAEDGVWRFHLPPGAHRAVLLSRVAYNEADSPESRGLYPLGVKVSRIVRCGWRTREEIDMADPALSDGFYAAETHDGDAFRWTSGAAVIPMDGPNVAALEFHVSVAPRYLAAA